MESDGMAVNPFEIWWVSALVNASVLFNGIAIGGLIAGYLIKKRNWEESKLTYLLVAFQALLNLGLLALIITLIYLGIGSEESVTLICPTAL